MTHTQTSARWGATPAEWQFWAFAVGAGADLLPAIADPYYTTERRSPRLQHLDSLAKTPSWVGSNGIAYGVAGWVAHQATPEMVRGWSANPAYNILLITRNVRAIDIDIGDSDKAQAMEQFICARLGVQLPVRSRNNSGKRTLLLRTDPPAPMRKRVIKTAAGNLEFLADGQQTALCGTHPSGARFELTRLEQGVPVVSLRALEGVWDELRNAYDQHAKPLVVPEEQQAEFIIRQGGTLRDDHVLQWLENEGWVLGYEANGTANIRCPWESEHSAGGNPNATSWLPAGLGGKERGAFRCLHAHCEGRHTGLFLEKIGHTMAEINKAFAPLASGGVQLSPTLQIMGGVQASPVVPQDGSGAPADTSVFKGVPLSYGDSMAPADTSCFRGVPKTTPAAPLDPFTGKPMSEVAAYRIPAALDPFTGKPMTEAEPYGSGVPANLDPFTGKPDTTAWLVQDSATEITPYKGASVVQHLQPDLTPAQQEVVAAQQSALLVAALREAGVSMERDDKTGKILKKQNNLHSALRLRPDLIAVRFDHFAQTLEVSMHQGPWKPITDNTITELRVLLERATEVTFDQVDIGRALYCIGDKANYDSAKERLSGLRWDGVSRIAKFDTDILKVHSTEYSRALSAYMWVAMAGRVLQPGCKADIAPILISARQGTGKSSLVENMALEPTWYGKINMSDKDDDISRKMRGRVTVEIPELRGLTGRDASSAKDFLSTTSDSWVPKYKEHSVDVPRRCLFIGTANEQRMLTDPTGNRRWAPLPVAVTARHVDWPRMRAEIEQYWAEAAAMLAQFATPADAVEYYSTKLRHLAGPAIMAATVQHHWFPPIKEFVERQAKGAVVRLLDIAQGAFGCSLLNLRADVARVIRESMQLLGHEEVAPDNWLAQGPTL